MQTKADNVAELVTVIIPTYNRVDLLPRAIDSVLRQSYKNIELIIVDDGSNDGTEKLLANIDDPRVRIVEHTTNYGQNAALNSGVCVAKGYYVGFCDSDDAYLPDYVEKFLTKFRSDHELGAVYCTLITKSSNTEQMRVAMPFTANGHVYKEALIQGYLSHMITIMVKRECFKRTGLFDTNFTCHQDDDFCFRVAKHFKVGLIDESLAVQFEDASASRVTANRLNYAEGFRRLLDKFRHDILTIAGETAWLNHNIKLAYLFIEGGDIATARKLLLECIGTFNKLASSSDKGFIQIAEPLKVKLITVIHKFNLALVPDQLESIKEHI